MKRILLNLCSYVLGDKDEALIPFPAVSDQANWMGDPGLRCLTCLGKFGPPVGDLRCEFCVLLYRLQDLVVSERFPQTGIKFVTPDLRGAYYKALEVADSYRHFTQGGPPPPRPEDKKLPLVEPKVAETTPKSRPPVKESIGEAEVSGVKEEEREGEIEPSSSVKEEEEKVSRKEKKKRDRGEENPSEEARPRRETRSERSRSRRSRSSREALQRT